MSINASKGYSSKDNILGYINILISHEDKIQGLIFTYDVKTINYVPTSKLF